MNIIIGPDYKKIYIKVRIKRLNYFLYIAMTNVLFPYRFSLVLTTWELHSVNWDCLQEKKHSLEFIRRIELK